MIFVHVRQDGYDVVRELCMRSLTHSYLLSVISRPFVSMFIVSAAKLSGEYTCGSKWYARPRLLYVAAYSRRLSQLSRMCFCSSSHMTMRSGDGKLINCCAGSMSFSLHQAYAYVLNVGESLRVIVFRLGCVQNCAFNVSIQRRHDLMRARSTLSEGNRTEMPADRYHSDNTCSGCERKHSLLHRWQHIRTSLAQPICLPFATKRHAKRAAGLPTPSSTLSSIPAPCTNRGQI